MQLSVTFYMRCIEAIRRIFLYIFVLSLLTLVLWVYGGHFLGKADKELKRAYKKYYTYQLDVARSLMTDNPSIAIGELLDLNSDLDEVRKLDRLAKVKADSMKLLSELYAKMGHFDKSLEWSKHLLRFDDKDLHAHAYYAEKLLNSSGYENKAGEYIRELYIKVPEAEVIAELYAELLFQEGDYVGAVRVLVGLYESAQKTVSGDWRFFWDNGTGFSPKQMALLKTEITGESSFKLPLHVKKGVKRVRIDFPPYSKLRLNSPYISQTSTTNLPLINLNEVASRFNHMSQQGEVFITSGGDDPYFHFAWPEHLAIESREVVFTATVVPQYAKKLRDIVHRVGSEKLVALLLEQNYADEVVHVEAVVKQHSDDGGFNAELASDTVQMISVYWSEGLHEFDEDRRSDAALSVGHAITSDEFEVEINVNSKVSSLRIDFPSIEGRVYTFSAIEAVGVGRVINIDLISLKVALNNNINIQGGHFTVLGDDPYFSFQLSEEVFLLKKMVLKGSVR